MRVELLYKPGCGKYRKTLEHLQTVIAEERLPIPVELTESTVDASPLVKVDGESLGSECFEELRTAINTKWSAHTHVPCR